ncbi:MAG: hypothetical protein ACI9SJ_002010 [Flavobacteriaceae bacterium]|jgi:hypothetical protein|tara:strand:+ start:232 stop:387 length:156 start_codon:yes stop_codon:yes gene_type:complete
MVDLGQKKVNFSLPFFMRQIFRRGGELVSRITFILSGLFTFFYAPSFEKGW